MADKTKNLLNENAFLPDPKKRKNLDTSKPIDIKLKEEKERNPIYHTLPREGVFKQYENLDIIAAQIAKELLSEQVYNAVDISKTEYKKIIEGGLTFFMSSEHSQERSGLLSICPAVLTAMKIWSAMPESSLKTKLFTSIEAGIDAIFKIIYRDEEQVLNDGAPVFDASPYAYETNAFSKGLTGRSYIDSISWAVPVFLRILNLTEKKDKKEVFVFQDNNLRKKSEFLAKWCLKYTNGCLLLSDDGKTPIGWSFTRLEKYRGAERSLYFTYAASTIYLSFYAEYEKIILSQRTIDEISSARDYEDAGDIHFDLNEKYWENKNNELGKALETISNTLESKQKQVEQEGLDEQTIEDLETSITNLKKIKEALDVLLDPENAEKIRALAEFNDENRITNEAKGENDSLEKVGQIARLKWNLEQISAQIWNKAGKDLEDKFLYEDFAVAENDAIAKSGQTNALFTGLLLIGIILNCAYDVRIYSEKGQREYETMQNAMLLHVQKTQRFFDKLGEGDVDKSFAVDSLILKFMEKVNDGGGQGAGLSDRELVEILRKHNIRVCSLTPMLLKTNNLLSEYVIQYPQKQMGESLLRISQKRYYDKSNKDKERFRWLWETDNYHSISNYYYVGAIFDFYTYYKKYEQMYVKRYENMRTDLLRDLNFTEQVRKHYQDIADEKKELEKEYKGKLKAKDDEIAEALAKAKKSEIGEDLVTDINKVIKDSVYFEDPIFFKKIINGMRKQLAEELAARYAQNPSEDRAVLEKLTQPSDPKDGAFFSLLQALAADIILPSAIEARKSEGTGLVTNLGKEGLEGIMPSDFALKGGKQLIKDGLIDKLFAFMCQPLIWKDQKNI